MPNNVLLQFDVDRGGIGEEAFPLVETKRLDRMKIRGGKRQPPRPVLH